MTKQRIGRRSRGFTLIEILLAFSVALVIAGVGFGFASSGRRSRYDQALKGRIAAIDQAQLEYLRRHPGHSLQTAGAPEEITASVQRIEGPASARDIAVVLSTWTISFTERPVTARSSDRTITYPQAN